MSWHHYYQRRDAIDLVLARASQDPSAGLPYADLPTVTEVFSSPRDLALALQYKWTQLLTGHIGVALHQAEEDPDTDRVDAVADAWRTSAAEHPVLRAVLDQYSDVENAAEDDAEFQTALRTEQRMMALAAGLVDFREPTDEITRVGAALLVLVRSTPQRTPGHRNPVEALLRRFAPSA